jgi:copper oxidase (laccase) domain-containing protein
VAENRRRALAAAGADAARAVSLRQRHGTVVVDAGAVAGGYLDAGVRWPEGDALVTRDPGLPVIAHGADCLTAALVAADGSRLAVAHAGWRGPGAGACCYEVGDDVAGPLRERFGDDVVSGGRADLATAARRALEGAGARDVVTSGLCTICDPDRFHSHRRDGAGSGRQAVIAQLAGGRT